MTDRRQRTLQAGKFPVAVWRQVVRYRGAHDPHVILGPALGEDAAVIDLGRHCLVLKSDPVTFTTAELGWYVVHVNANDIAVMGAQPRWFQPTIILPPGCTAETAITIARDIHRAARSLGIAVTGGHSEVSPAVRQPIVAGDMQGLVRRDRLILSRGARPGDRLVMTKSAGIEGTAILAREYADDGRRVLGAAAWARAARFHRRPGISVVADALTAAKYHVTALHDPTEGGVANGLNELAAASRSRLIVDLAAINVHPLTQRLCQHFGLRPLGLIASGALLASVGPQNVNSLLRALRARGTPARIIGEVVRGTGIEAYQNGRRVAFTYSERDELARFAAATSRRHRRG